jgi:hypothetical protein
MALPTSGPISLGQIRAELNLSGPISLGQGNVRSLLRKTSGVVSLADARSGSSSVLMTLVVGQRQVSNLYEQTTKSGFNKSPAFGSLTPATLNDTGITINGLYDFVNSRSNWQGSKLFLSLACGVSRIIMKKEDGTVIATFEGSPSGTEFSHVYNSQLQSWMTQGGGNFTLEF